MKGSWSAALAFSTITPSKISKMLSQRHIAIAIYQGVQKFPKVLLVRYANG